MFGPCGWLAKLDLFADGIGGSSKMKVKLLEPERPSMIVIIEMTEDDASDLLAFLRCRITNSSHESIYLLKDCLEDVVGEL